MAGSSSFIARMKRVRQMIKDGASVKEISGATGVGNDEIAMQRVLLVAAGFSVKSGRAIQSAAASKARANERGDASDLDLVSAFSVDHSRSALSYWGHSDE